MATQATETSDFIKNLGRMYGLYTGGFVGFIIFLAILEQIGVPNKILGYLFVFRDPASRSGGNEQALGARRSQRLAPIREDRPASRARSMKRRAIGPWLNRILPPILRKTRKDTGRGRPG